MAASAAVAAVAVAAVAAAAVEAAVAAAVTLDLAAALMRCKDVVGSSVVDPVPFQTSVGYGGAVLQKKKTNS